MSDISSRVDKLRQRLEELNHAYYVLDDPRTADSEYDDLFRELQDLEAKHPELDSLTSPTKKVGGQPLDEFQSYAHKEPMLSLANALNEEEVKDWDERIRKLLGDELKPAYTFEPKVDGIGISLSYAKGELVMAATRGDGTTGEDVTPNVRTIKSIPWRLRASNHAHPDFIEIRGEVYAPVADFKAFNEARSEAEGRYANPRNFTSGSLRQLDSSMTSTRPLDALFYSAGRIEGQQIKSQTELIAALKSWGLKVAEPYFKSSDTIDEIIRWHRELEIGRDAVPYEIDGTVLKVDSSEQQQILGFRSRTPRWALACKFKSRQASTTLKDIVISVGRTGALTPVAVLEPVALAGVTVSSASLHNAEEIERLDLRIGDRVLVERAGDVIPKVIKVLTQERQGNELPFAMPKVCPSCNSPVAKDPVEIVIRCPNLACPGKLKGSVQHFTSKDALNVDGLGEKLVTQLVDAELVRDLADVLELQFDDVVALERMGKTSTENLIKAIDRAKKTTLTRAIYGLGIRHVGEHVAEVLAQHSGSLEKLIDIPIEDLTAIHEIGDKAAGSVREFSERSENRELIKKILSAGLETRVETRSNGGILGGKTIVITGTLPSLSRKEAENLVKKHGGKPVGSISKKTDFLLAGEKAGSKLKKAESLGVVVIDEEKLRQMINEKWQD